MTLTSYCNNCEPGMGHSEVDDNIGDYLSLLDIRIAPVSTRLTTTYDTKRASRTFSRRHDWAGDCNISRSYPSASPLKNKGIAGTKSHSADHCSATDSALITCFMQDSGSLNQSVDQIR